ncbi:MAG: response regulator transcription factor [Adlercreutzia equolifaciens]
MRRLPSSEPCASVSNAIEDNADARRTLEYRRGAAPVSPRWKSARRPWAGTFSFGLRRSTARFGLRASPPSPKPRRFAHERPDLPFRRSSVGRRRVRGPIAAQLILEARGSVRVAALGTKGAEAAALFNERHPDIMLLDIRMPDLSGLAAGEAIPAAHPKARIVFLTTFADDDYIACARAGDRGPRLPHRAGSSWSGRSAASGFGVEAPDRPGIRCHLTA